MKPFSAPAIFILTLLLVSGCINPHAVVQRKTGPGWYQVKPSDTLYSIAWRYGLDYKELASWNQIAVNSTIYPGQRLMLLKPSGSGQSVASVSGSSVPQSAASTTSPSQPTSSTAVQPSRSVSSGTTGIGKNPSSWRWPTKGKLISTYSAKELDRRGIDIAGELGQAIQAVADGRVVYSGNGLAGYGNLIIIKHSETYLSAYAYNKQRLVNEGETVKAGKLIARMGEHKTRKARLHFQIRKNGKPVDPLQYLPKR